MNPNPRERSDLLGVSFVHDQRSVTHPLVINDGYFFDSAEATEFFVQVTLLSANAESEDPKHVRRIRRLFLEYDKKTATYLKLTIGACGGRLGGGD